MSAETTIRLQKYLAQAGIASRRHAEALIVEGRVEVDGRVVTELGSRVDPDESRVKVDGRLVGGPAERATVILNKPAGVVSTMKDPEGRRTVRSIVEEEPFRLVPVGRLDYASEGALLLTTDGELAHRLMHPSFKAPKVYVVKVGGHPTEDKLGQLRKGVRLEDGRTQPAVVEVVREDDRHTWLEFVLTEGRNRQIRRMCEAIGHRAFRVYRTEFAGVSIDGLRPGQFRYLTQAELHRLYDTVGLVDAVPEVPERATELRGRPSGRAERRKGALPGEGRTERRPELEAASKKPRGRPVTARAARREAEETPKPRPGSAARGAEERGGRARSAGKRVPTPKDARGRKGATGRQDSADRKPVGIAPSAYRKLRGTERSD